MERYTDSQTYYVVFDRAHSKHWISLFLHPRFQHVHLLRDNRDFCLLINSFAHCMAIREYPNTLEDILFQEAEPRPTPILQMTVHYGSIYKPAPIELLTCVSVAKRLLGIRTRCLTPRGLYKEMIKAGATVIIPYCPDNI